MMDVPFTKEQMTEAHLETLRANHLKSAYLRPVFFYGADTMGVQITEKNIVQGFVAAWEWGAYLGDEAITHGIKVRTSSFTRHHVNSTMCKAKATGSYINSTLARQEATAAGCAEALLLDTEGHVAEGSGENIFLVANGVLYTPDLNSCLAGITRETIMTLAKEMDIQVVEKQITRDEVYIADEAFFTGTAVEVTPIREVDGRKIGAGEPGPITKALQKVYFDQVQGKRKEHSEWLTYF